MMDKQNDLAEKIFLIFLEKYCKELDVTNLNLWMEFFNQDEDKDLLLNDMIKTAKDVANLFYQ